MRADIEWLEKQEISNEIVVEVEKNLDICFPSDFRNFIINHSGAYPIPHTYDFIGRDEAVLNNIIDFDLDLQDNVIKTYELVKDRLLLSIFPFAEDPFGNLICFDYRETQTNPKIVFWDHELTKDDPDNFQYICDSFTELLDKLYDV